MKRGILACVAGLVTWTVAASLLNWGLRLGIEGYAAAEPTMRFTLGMMAARLTEGAIASLVAGAIVGWITRGSVRVALVLGGITLAAFIPVHVSLWNKFPVWYHLTFLLTLVPLVVFGSWLTRGRTTVAPVVGAV
jgi:hypothetical protein